MFPALGGERMPTAVVEDGISIAYDEIGSGPPLLLLHGFPQTRAMWAEVAPALAEHFRVVTADLRGYGASSKPPATSDLANYSFRAMGADMFALMSSLGHERFHLVGHDRGARAAYRMALDAPGKVESLTLMDIVPTDHLVEAWDYELSGAYFHWSFLAQPAPLPERMIGADPDHFFEACLSGWGGAAQRAFAQIGAYRAAWRDPATIAGMTNDYRAAVSADLELDAASRGQVIECPALVLWGADGVMARHFDARQVWAPRLSNLTVELVPGGHFFVDQSPGETAEALCRILLPLAT